MKIAVSSYSFSGVTQTGEYNQFTIIQKAKDMGFDAIEFVDIIPHDESTPVEYAKKLRAECARVGLPVSNFTFGADFINCPDIHAEIERVKSMVDMADILGAKSLRHDATVGKPGVSFDKVLPVLADACRQVTEYAAQKGIVTMVENHGFFCQDSRRVEQLYNAVDHPNFGLLCDMGNFLCADENPAESFGIVAPYARYVHAKDFHIKSADQSNPGAGFFQSRNGTYLRGAIIGHGNVPVKHCLTALKRAGYQGSIAIEFEGMEATLKALEIGLANLRRYIAEVEL